MTDQATGLGSVPRRGSSLALASCALWLAAAATSGALGIWTAIGGAAVALGLAIVVLERPVAVALLRPRVRLLLIGAVVGGAMAAATHLIYPLVAQTLPFIATDTARLYAAFRAPSLVVASLALVPIVVGEELVWRGVVQGALVRGLGTWRGVALAAVVYALVHAPLGSFVLVVVAFACGLAWGALRAATASLVPVLVAHLLWNVLVLLWLPLDTI